MKPDNFLVGLKEFAPIIYAVDFGLAKRYCDPKTKVHIPYKDGKSLTGTARYASIATHNGIEQSRRDDLEAMCYVLLYLVRGGLPWQGLAAKTRAGKYVKVRESKQAVPIEVLCKGCPSIFFIIMLKIDEMQGLVKHARELAFDAEPDYEYMRKLILRMYKHCDSGNDLKFDWLGKPDYARKCTDPTIATSYAKRKKDKENDDTVQQKRTEFNEKKTKNENVCIQENEIKKDECLLL